MVVPKLVALFLGLGLVSLVWAVVRGVLNPPRVVGLNEKRRVLRGQCGLVRFLAGEINPSVWRDIICDAKDNPELTCVEVIVGPWILIDDWIADAAELVKPKETNGAYSLRKAEDIWKLHPLFSYVQEDIQINGDNVDRRKMRVWVKRTPLPVERHFFVGNRPADVCIEFHHQRGPFQGAVCYRNNRRLSRLKREDWERICYHDGLCVELIPETVEQIAQFPELEFCAERNRPKEPAQLPAPY